MEVEGDPATAGSKDAFRRGAKIVVVDSCKRGPAWRRTVQAAARKALGEEPPIEGAISLHATFALARPKAHLNARGEVRPTAPHSHTIRPDATKLLRALEDALNGVWWRDDSQVVSQSIAKCWAVPGDPPGVHVAALALDDAHDDWGEERHAAREGR